MTRGLIMPATTRQEMRCSRLSETSCPLKHGRWWPKALRTCRPDLSHRRILPPSFRKEANGGRDYPAPLIDYIFSWRSTPRLLPVGTLQLFLFFSRFCPVALA